jgi:hypothetical protein
MVEVSCAGLAWCGGLVAEKFFEPGDDVLEAVRVVR